MAAKPTASASAQAPNAGAKRPRINSEEQAHYQVPVLVNGQVEYRDVKVGINNKINAEITEGLKEGEEVIIGMPSSGSNNRFRRSPMGF
jgi:macrolide-specific efflux system membrane fusion protein